MNHELSSKANEMSFSAAGLSFYVMDGATGTEEVENSLVPARWHSDAANKLAPRVTYILNRFFSFSSRDAAAACLY